MTYQGERARPLASEKGRYFEVSSLRLDADGFVSQVLWGEVDPASSLDVGARVLATCAEVMDAIHDGASVTAAFPASGTAGLGQLPERLFVVAEHGDGRELLALEGADSPGRNLADIASLDA